MRNFAAFAAASLVDWLMQMKPLDPTSHLHLRFGRVWSLQHSPPTHAKDGMNALIHSHGHHPHQQHPTRTRNSNSLSVYSLNETGIGRLIFNDDYTEFDGALVNFQDELYQVTGNLN
jgi:hypothetical protein